MGTRIPQDAFTYYISLGAERSYRAVAEKFGVTKQGVAKLATREQWQERVHELDSQAKKNASDKALESLDAMNERHLKTLKVTYAKALETLKAMPLTTAMEAVRTIDLAIRLERTIRGEPTERSQVNIEEVIRREYERWMGPNNHTDEIEDDQR